jgi:hypothetical protein
VSPRMIGMPVASYSLAAPLLCAGVRMLSSVGLDLPALISPLARAEPSGAC